VYDARAVQSDEWRQELPDDDFDSVKRQFFTGRCLLEGANVGAVYICGVYTSDEAKMLAMGPLLLELVNKLGDRWEMVIIKFIVELVVVVKVIFDNFVNTHGS
jgi:hypothetical protein